MRNDSNYEATKLVARKYICGYCSSYVSSDKGYPLYNKGDYTQENVSKSGTYGGVYICPFCENATYFDSEKKQTPGPLIGNQIENISSLLESIYNEIRKDISNGCYTSAVLLSRKMLMHIAVEEGLKFVQYINFLEEKSYIHPKGRGWVEEIRKKGNEATHEIILMKQKMLWIY